MTYFTAHTQLDELKQALENEPEAHLIICFCAQWCRTCQQYQKDFKALAKQWPDHFFIWIDVEELPELLGDEDVEDFPTLQIQTSKGTVFFGAMLPHSEHLDRLLRDFQHQDLPPVSTGPGDLRQLITTAT